MSVGGSEYNTAEMSHKMKHTRDFKKKGFKGNSRGDHIQAPFATLEDLFKKLPPSVGFNMEMSMLCLFLLPMSPSAIDFFMWCCY